MFLIQPYFLYDQKYHAKSETFWEQKDLLTWVLCNLRVLGHFVLKKQTKKIDKIYKDLWTISTLYEQFSVLNWFNIF